VRRTRLIVAVAAAVGTVAASLAGAALAPTSVQAQWVGTPSPSLADPTAAWSHPSASPETAVLPGMTRAGTRPPVVTNGVRTGNKVALTFDADMTDAMLYNLASGAVKSYANLAVIETLEARHIPATFFLTGQWVKRYPEVTRRLAANPDFELGNHTYRHQGFTPRCYTLSQIPVNLMAEDVARTFGVITPYGGRQTRYFRFPGGCYHDAALQALAPLGLTVIQWDVVSGDPYATAPQPIVNAVMSQVRAGSIVVLHVTEANAQYTDEALPAILDGLAKRGLQPVTVSELLSPAPEP
jgi:hypothetical protein